MEELWERIKRNLLRSYKSIRFSWREYASFFAAIFLIQSFFWLIMLTGDAQAAELRHNAEQTYDYHISVGGLNQDQAIRLQNGSYAVFLSDQLYELVKVEETPNAYGGTSYTVYCRITAEPLEEKLSLFQRKHLNPLIQDAEDPELIRVDRSPAMTLDDDIAEARAPFYAMLGIFALVATLVLMLLYNIRINHFKFLYGIYMSFGADYKKLLYTAAWELVTVSLLTLGPALIFAALVRLVLAIMLGGQFAISLWTIPVVFVLNLLIIFAAVALPMRVVSMRRPVDLLSAEDNGNLVSSPRRSFKLFGEQFPDRYATGSIWRFRTYYIRLLASSVIFAALSVSVLYVGTMYADDLGAPLVPYTIESLGKKEYIAADMGVAIAALDGVERVEYHYNLGTAIDAVSHILVPSERTMLAGSKYNVAFEAQGLRAKPVTDNAWRAVNRVEYSLIDELTIASLEQMAASSGGDIVITGDLRAALTDPRTVVISDSIYNTKRFDFRPGDKIRLAHFHTLTGKIPENLTDLSVILSQQLLKADFSYTELTVGAVVSGLPADRYLTLGLNYDACVDVLGITPAITRLDVVVSPDLDGTALGKLDHEMENLFAYYDRYVVTTRRAHEEADLEHRMGVEPMLNIVAGMVLAFFPLVCFFSQLLFYFKRNKEFSVLLALGAVEQEIHRLHRIDGILVSAANFVLTLLLSFSLNWVIFRSLNDWLPAVGMVETVVRYHYGISPWMLILSLLAAVGCGYLSCEIPFRQFIARRRKLTDQAEVLSGGKM